MHTTLNLDDQRERGDKRMTTDIDKVNTELPVPLASKVAPALNASYLPLIDLLGL